MENLNEKLIEPLKYYYEEIKDNFKEQTSSFFDELVKKSNIDIELNKKISKEYEELSQEKQKINKKLYFFKIISNIILGLGILGLIISGYLIYLIYTNRFYFYKENLIKTSIYILVSICLLFLKFKVFSPKIKILTEKYNDLEEKSSQKLYDCYASMLPLNNLMDSKYTFELINKHIPFVKIDPYFNMKRFEELYYVYGMQSNTNKNYSTLEAVSGNVLGNPFVLLKEMEHKIIDCTYTGSLTISWTETYRDSDGNFKTRTVSQTLRASIIRPKPEYSKFVSLILANDVASKLSFDRRPSHIEQLSDSALKSKIKKEEKNLYKLQEKSISKGSSFVTMANSEFEILFNALNRNNETEFRLLFTPLAQKNMVRLLKNKEYGDNFYFSKKNKINTIVAEHTGNWDLDCNAHKFKNYSYEKCKEYFVNFNTQYFNNFFFTIAPLISIPLYQQYMAKDYIYNSEFHFNYNPYMAETLANAMDYKNFVHSDTKTPAILKASPLAVKGETDLVKIKSYSYDIIPRVEYVRMKGGDGYYHNVPVYWDEYIPLSNETSIELKKLDISDKNFEDISSSKDRAEIFEDKNSFAYKNKIFARLSNKTVVESENLLNNILKNFNKI